MASQIEPRTLKGFRDFLPQEARKRQYVINTLRKVFELYGFEPLETPALEYEDILLGKYGEEGDKLMYRFEDNGKRKVALRYDQTVPTARVAAQYQAQLPTPFKRYQIQPVWRAENTQKGRFREFLQCDADIIGIDNALADAEVIATTITGLQRLGFKNMKVLVNDRAVFSNLVTQNLVEEKDIPFVVRIIDKVKKIGREKVVGELAQKYSTEQATAILQYIESQNATPRVAEILSNLEKLGFASSYYEFSPSLARGLDYYTGLIFEIEIAEYAVGSVCGGGRYDKLIGMFAGKDIPAVGFAFGFDRVIEAMDELDLFPQDLVSTKYLVTIFSKELQNNSIEITNKLRSAGINAEIYLNSDAKLDKQLKYANNKKVPYVIIYGPQEKEKGIVKVKNMKTTEQKEVTVDQLLSS